MKKRLIRVFDNNNFLNVVIALSMEFDEVFYIYHNEIDKFMINNACEILKKYKKELEVKFQYIKEDEKEITSLLTDNTTIDISTSKYLNAFLFEKSLNQNVDILYYDNKESVIKDYRKHIVIKDKIFKLSIEDIVKLGGGKINSKQMHNNIDINNKIIVDAICGAVENNLNNYSAFTNYIQRINAYISHREINNNSYELTDEIVNKIKYDEMYKKISNYNLFKIENNILTFLNNNIDNMFNISGSFLENYLYIKLKLSNKFDEVLMSQVIDFSSYYNRYPIACGIDCLVIKDNHLLFISCKSNKVETDDLNEIKIHNIMFGNDLSESVMCTLQDLNTKAPAIYSKAKELKIAVLDKTAFINKTLVDDLVDIVERKYNYEKV